MNPQYEKKVGQNIRRLREERQLTQEQLSAKLQTLLLSFARKTGVGSKAPTPVT